MHTLKHSLSLYIYRLFPLFIILSCSLITMHNPCQDSYNPNPVWANDCNGFAYVVMDCENQSYSIHTVNTDGVDVSVIVNRSIDNALIQVESLYFMKTVGYIIVKIILLGKGIVYFEKVTIEGSFVSLGQSEIDTYETIPSPNGDLLCFLSGDLRKTNYQERMINATIKNANTLEMVFKYELNLKPDNWYWESDTSFVV